MSENPGWRPPLRVLALWPLAVVVAIWITHEVAWPNGQPAVVWLSNAPQTAALLLLPRRQWPAMLTAFVLVETAYMLPFSPWPMVLLGNIANLIEVLVVGFALHPDRDWVDGRSDRLRSWLRFVLFGMVLGPLTSALIGASAVVTFERPGTSAYYWVIALGWYANNVVA